jgi:putative ABC transport system permease protein
MRSVISILALRSLRHRRATAALTVLSIAMSVFLLLAIERLREEAREGFAATVSGTDLIVGARTSGVHLLLTTVFHVGEAGGGLRWSSYRALADHPSVAWTVPLTLGDSHRGHRVIGTTPDFFQHYRHGRAVALALSDGRIFTGPREAVLGAEAARRLGYSPGASMVLAHGSGDDGFMPHADRPFRVSGILAPTGTPVDRTVLVTLEDIDALHAPERIAQTDDPLAAALMAAEPAAEASRTITAFLVGLRTRPAALSMQRTVNTFPDEPLTAILPTATLQEVWALVSVAEEALRAVSIMAVVVGLAGMLVALLTGIGERRREMAILRSVGARPSQVFALVAGEAAALTLAGVIVGALVLHVALPLAGPWLASRIGLVVGGVWPSVLEWQLMALVLAAGTLVGIIPAWRLYRHSLADGLAVRT